MKKIIFITFIFFYSHLNAAQDYHSDAVEKLIAHHDYVLYSSLGSIVLKQSCLIELRKLLFDIGENNSFDDSWNMENIFWKKAESELTKVIDEQIRKNLYKKNWLQKEWHGLMMQKLNGEEADEINDHFSTEIGKKQREIIDLQVVFESLQFVYTLSNKLSQNFQGSEEELKRMQSEWWSRAPLLSPVAGDNQELKKQQKEFSSHPAVIRFAGQETGKKYVKTIAVEGLGLIMSFFERTKYLIFEEIKLNLYLIDPIVEKYKEKFD